MSAFKHWTQQLEQIPPEQAAAYAAHLERLKDLVTGQEELLDTARSMRRTLHQLYRLLPERGEDRDSLNMVWIRLLLRKAGLTDAEIDSDKTLC